MVRYKYYTGDELMMLAASYELHKFYHDSKEVLSDIKDKQNEMSAELGKDQQQVAILQRKHVSFQSDLAALGAQVKDVQDEAARLRSAYAGDKARDIDAQEQEVVDAWNALNQSIQLRASKLDQTDELYRFLNMVRALLLWMDDVILSIKTEEKADDVSGVELMMNQHQSIKAEIDSRDDSFTQCFNLGKEMLSRDHYASEEIRAKLMQVGNKRVDMIEDWEHRWEYLQLILEVFMWARDAQSAEAWLFAQEQYLKSEDYGNLVGQILLRLPTGSEYLFQAKDQNEVEYWVGKLQGAAGVVDTEKRAATFPASEASAVGGKKSKSKGLFTMRKK
ncbi:putative spectrin beta chain, non-erythrocytic 1 isoform X2 [Apostichopus japonicus]|uniref:Putative spectrin beta chain, non-erythrocytic 1 isoform X2 n=1 Tax=Stichopus japonicus TaxID=307972 RepID=A0A2G8L4T2_STIJA|nr:putative spectrin beta chain, non-erythrocytic 1 isoform X2 [Apostichopus japonicus]